MVFFFVIPALYGCMLNTLKRIVKMCFLEHSWLTVHRFKQVVNKTSRSSALRLGLFHRCGRFFQLLSKTYSLSQH